MQKSNVSPIGQASQSNPNFPPNQKDGDLLVNVYTSVHAYGERSNSPCIGQVLVSNLSQMPHLSPCSPGGG